MFKRHSFKSHSFKKKFSKHMSSKMKGPAGFSKFKRTKKINRPRLVTRGGFRL